MNNSIIVVQSHQGTIHLKVLHTILILYSQYKQIAYLGNISLIKNIVFLSVT